MKILRNYILKDFISAFLFSILALTLVMILGNLVRVSDMVIRKGVNFFDAVRMFAFYLPYVLKFIIPLSTLMGVLLAMGRLIADNELIAINTAGVSLGRILSLFLIVGFMLSLVMFILNDKILPDLHYHYRYYFKNIYAKNLSALIEPGVYLENFKDTILYVDDIKDNTLKNVYVYTVNDEGLSEVTYAKRGEFVVDEDVLKMKLEGGFRDQISPKDTKELFRLNFKVFFVDLPIESKENVQVDKKPSDMTIRELSKKIERLQAMNITPLKFLAEMHKRISFSFAPLIFVLLGFGISLVVRHRERSINFGIAVVSAGVYYLLTLGGETMAEFGHVTPLVGMWTPNILAGMVGLFLIVKNAYIR